jgi:hypothetical protein
VFIALSLLLKINPLYANLLLQGQEYPNIASPLSGFRLYSESESCAYLGWQANQPQVPEFTTLSYLSLTMKKLLIIPALCLLALGSWAFYPRTAAPAEYMELSVHNGGGRPTLVMISPAGQVTEEKLTAKIKGDYKYQAQVVVRLNELHSLGWTVVQMQQTETRTPDLEHPLLSPDVVRTAIYLLERR